MKLGKIQLPKTAALAPMAGVGDRAFREICREWGACYVVGEMASSKGMQFHNRKTAQLLALSEAERPAAVQLFGDDPAIMADSARLAMEYRPDVLDINMGCPAPKIAGGGAGSALMKTPELAGEIIAAVCNAVEIPVTVKLRKGWNDQQVNAVEMAIIAQQAGAAAVTIHGRTREQMYTPPVDLSIITRVKAAVSIPVIGNGDVDSAQSAVEMYEATGCDLVMVGRGALGAPWVFEQIRHRMETGEEIPAPPLSVRMEVMLKHISLACAYKGEYVAMKEARRHVGCYVRGLKNAAAYRRQAGTLSRYEELGEFAALILRENQGEEAL
ncbi:tRNA dihydrouridine synthase DusB [Oscillospiraceae bacterium MB08-C2-2]|nr:tRNA dihydrouridine synthase DusB [Oscillospiraceae bacterium MB08-C2-2]